MEEIWKDIDGYNGLYQVSNLGGVRSIRFNPPKYIYQSVTNCGYRQVKLYKNGEEKHIGVHRLVASAFVDGYQDGLEVNHKDLNKANNVYTNLEWVTRAENQKHQYLAYHSDSKDKKLCPVCGKDISPNAKYCMEHRRREEYPNIDDLREDLKTLSIKKIGEKYNYSDNGIRKICKKYGLPFTQEQITEYRKQQGVYVPPKQSVSKPLTERYVYYDVNEISDTAQGWSRRLGLEKKHIGRYAHKHTYEETVSYIKSLLNG